MPVERELKLAAGPAFHLPPLDDLADGITADSPEEGRYETVYFDTADLRLARWGCSLRHRTKQGWTLKLPGEVAQGLLARTELEFSGPSTRPPAAALAPVRAYVRHDPVAPVARLSTWRRKVRLREGGAVVAEVVDDEVSVLDGRRVAARFREVEVEIRDERGDRLLGSLVDRLRHAGAAREDQVPKHVRAIGPRAAEPAEVAPPPLHEGATAGEVVRAAIANSVALMLRHDPVVRLGGDPEGVHQMRVATRRLRSHLRTFRTLLEESPGVAELTAELGWLADQLGEVRDLEVLEDRLRKEAELLPPEDAAIGIRVAALLEAQIEPARKQLLESLDSARYIALVERLVVFANAVPLTGAHEEPASQVLPALVLKPWRRLKAAVDGLPPPLAAGDDELHRIRILAKRTRYAAEAAAPVAGKEAERFAKAVTAVQTLLGEHQDSVVAATFLRSVAGAARRAFVAGELHELERGAQIRVREALTSTWKAARARPLREWLRR
jgi:CHAD domain-containing protein